MLLLECIAHILVLTLTGMGLIFMYVYVYVYKQAPPKSIIYDFLWIWKVVFFLLTNHVRSVSKSCLHSYSLVFVATSCCAWHVSGKALLLVFRQERVNNLSSCLRWKCENCEKVKLNIPNEVTMRYRWYFTQNSGWIKFPKGKRKL